MSDEERKPSAGYWAKDAQALLNMGATSIDAGTVRGLLAEIETIRTTVRGRRDMNQKTSEIHPDEHVRKEASVRANCYANALSDFERTIGKPDIVRAPWTPEEVESLNGYQECEFVHPFTGERGPNGEETILIATRDGWIERVGGPIVQDWAHWFMADGSWKKRCEAYAEALGVDL